MIDCIFQTERISKTTALEEGFQEQSIFQVQTFGNSFSLENKELVKAYKSRLRSADINS